MLTWIGPLRLWLIALWMSSLAGVTLIAGMAVGYIGWPLFVVAGIVGLVIGIPAGLWNARYLRRHYGIMRAS